MLLIQLIKTIYHNVQEVVILMRIMGSSLENFTVNCEPATVNGHHFSLCLCPFAPLTLYN